MSEANQSVVFSSTFSNWQESVGELLNKSDLAALFKDGRPILIKPNLVEILPPPITTPVELVREIILYLQKIVPEVTILIGEGCGSTSYTTSQVFEELGYSQLAAEHEIDLIDLNEEPCNNQVNSDCERWPEMYLPQILDEVFLLSVPQLKAHSLADVTLTMKNMMGCAPPSHYKGSGAWNKTAFHADMHAAIFDLNRYRTPDYTILDATIGMARAHLWGPQCDPPVQKLAASADPVAIDSYGASLLGKNWQDIDHIAMAHQVLGSAADFTLIS